MIELLNEDLAREYQAIIYDSKLSALSLIGAEWDSAGDCTTQANKIMNARDKSAEVRRLTPIARCAILHQLLGRLPPS